MVYPSQLLVSLLATTATVFAAPAPASVNELEERASPKCVTYAEGAEGYLATARRC